MAASALSSAAPATSTSRVQSAVVVLTSTPFNAAAALAASTCIESSQEHKSSRSIFAIPILPDAHPDGLL